MKRMAQAQSMLGCLLATLFSVGLTACGGQDGGAKRSEIALPTFSQDRVAQEAPVEVRRMLPGAFNSPSPSPSPNGLLTVSGNSEDTSLWLIDFATGEESIITPDGPSTEADRHAEQDAVFSPDGSRIAYTLHNSAYEIRSMQVDGTDVTVHHRVSLDYVPFVTDWSSDGRYVLVLERPQDDTPGGSRIATLDLTTSEYRVIKTLDVNFYGRPFFSPDGQFVAFDTPSGSDTPERDIFLMFLDGTGETTLIQTPDRERLLGWMPDGSGVLFGRLAKDSRAIWKLPLRDGQRAGPPELIKDDVVDITGIGFSDDAFYYALTVSTRETHMASFDIETGRALEALAPVADPPGRRTDFATWSPDGTSIAYFASANGRTDAFSRLIVQSVTGEILQDIPSTVESPLHAGWTSHGLVVWEGGGDQPGFYLVSFETGEATFLRGPPEDAMIPFTVSEDGSSVFIGDPFRAAITEYDLSTRSERVLVEHDGYDLAAFPDVPDAWITAGTVSPDGNKIVYQVGLRTRGTGLSRGGRALELHNLSTGESRSLGRFAKARGTSWSPDGRYVVFEGQTEPSGNQQLIRVSVEDGSAVVLAEGPSRFNRPKVSPDGRHVLVTTGEFRQEIWRMSFKNGN